MGADSLDADLPIGERALSRLRWRCRRGMLENDLFLQRFFDRYADRLTQQQAGALAELMDLSDPDLLDLQLGRKLLSQLDAGLDRDDVIEVLQMLRENR